MRVVQILPASWLKIILNKKKGPEGPLKE